MARKKTSRDEELSGRAKIRKKLLELYDDIEKGFIDQAERSDNQLDYWDIYNCELGQRQYYNGNSKIFVPIVHNAVNARKTRFTNQVFPKGGRYVEVVSEDGELPHAETALLEHYVRAAKLRTRVAPALNKNGDVEGQYNVYVGWSSEVRHVAWREAKPLKVGGVEYPDVEDIEEIEEDIISEDRPVVEVLPDSDVLVLPATCDSSEEALDSGGSVTIVRRWTKAALRRMIDDGEIDKEAGEKIIKEMQKAEKQNVRDAKKQHADAAGIKAAGKHCLGYETWTKLKIDGVLRLCRVYYGASDQILGCKLCPYWCDRCPLISTPVEKVSGSFKGVSQVKPCAEMQYAANDAINEGMDSAAYGLLPIIMTDPLKNPKIATMVLDLAAVWETSPNDTKFAQFPQLWKDAFEIVGAAKNEVFQTLGVNPAMMPQQTGQKGGKRNQAEIANEQQVDILTTADAVTVQEEGVWTPILQRFAEYDAQFRSDEITVKAYGYLGVRAAMEKIPPLQMGRRYSFIWFGVEQARNAAQLQQQIALANVIKGIPPQMMPGRKLDMTPLIEHAVASTFGPRIAPLVFVDESKKMALDPEIENELMRDGHDMPVSPMDDDPKHIESHAEAARQGDVQGHFQRHIFKHKLSMAMKAQAAQAQAQGLPGAPGGAGKGVAGTPRSGAQPAGGRPAQNPPGAMHADRMPAAGAVGMPRKM